MGSQTVFSLPNGISEKYSKVFAENSEILSKTFLLYTEENIPNIKSFLHLYTEVFKYSEINTLPEESFGNFVGDLNLLNKCIQKHRETFRQCFRGVQYLPTKKFGEVADKAYSDATSYLLSENTSNLENIKLRITLERKWIERINEQRRMKDLDEYKRECVEKFRAKIKGKFPYLYEPESLKSMRYTDENRLHRKLVGLLTASKKQYSSQLPFADQESDSIIGHLLFEFHRNLEENVTADLIARNLKKRKVAEEYIEKIVAESVKEYRDKMETFLSKDYKSFVLDAKIIQKEHKRLADNKVLILVTTKPLNCSKQLGIHFTNKYHAKAHEALKNILQKWKENVQLKLESKEEESQLEMRDGAAKLKEIFANTGMTELVDGFSSHVEETLKSMFEHVQAKNIATIARLEELTEPHIVTYVEHITTIERIIQSSKMLYLKEVVMTLHNSENEPVTVHDTHKIDRAIQTGKANVWHTISQQFPDLQGEDREEAEYFLEEFQEELLNNRELLIEILRRFSHSPVKFKETYYCSNETMIEGGKPIQVKVRMQSILEESGQPDVSFEELRFNDWNRHNHILKTAINMILPLAQGISEAKPNFDISDAFERCLKLTNTFSPLEATTKSLFGHQSQLSYSLRRRDVRRRFIK